MTPSPRLTDQEEVDIPFNNKVGTKRYMAPEVRVAVFFLFSYLYIVCSSS